MLENLFIAASFTSVIFALGELLVKNKTEKNILLSISYFIASYYLLHTYMIHSGLIHHYKFLFLTTTPLLAFLGPVSERYFLLILEDKKFPSYHFLIRLIPAFSVTCIIFPFYFREQNSDAILNDFGTVHIENIPLYVKLAVAVSLSSLFYFFLSPLFHIVKIITLETALRHKKSKTVFFMSIFCSFIVPAMAVFSLFFNRTSAHIFISSACGIFVCLLYLLKQRYPDFFAEFRAEMELEKKLRKSKISHLDLNGIRSKLKTLMEEEKVFLDEELTLGDLGKKLGISNHQLSEYLNTVENIQFYQLLNKYRVEEAKKNILHSSKKTFLEIALESGFNSKSSFNQVFKQVTGVTPSEFKKNLSKSNALDDRNSDIR